MLIRKFQIENFKSFWATPEITLTPGFNVVVGQNNVGKTALIEALSPRFGGKPHRSLRTAPTPDVPSNPNSTLRLWLQLSRRELLGYIHQLGQFPFSLSRGQTPEDGAAAFNAWMTEENILEAEVISGNISSARFAGFPTASGADRRAQLRAVGLEAVESFGGAQGGTLGFEWIAQIYNLARTRIYGFSAERLHIGASGFGPNTVLLPDASNLPQVLENFQANPARFRKFNTLVHTVLPTVHWVSVRPGGDNSVRILVSPIDPELYREDLVVPLTECGTGVGQVLAILYVALTAEPPQVILIDEPQSFLHPGAVRKLIEILQDYSQHQYVITTHSATAISAADPSTLILLRLRDGGTVVEPVNVTEAETLRLLLAELGARFSDVFGADNVLWVEGRTEEECFPRILRQRGKSLLGTTIVGVLQTGDFEGRRAEPVVRIYEHLSQGGALLPSAIGFVFDREGRTEREQAELQRLGKVKFLPRRMYENYLLDHVAIASVASSIAGFRDMPLSADEVEHWLDENTLSRRYFKTVPSGRADEQWVQNIHGALVLRDLFAQLSDTRVAYDKVKHGVALTNWLLEHQPETFGEIGALVLPG